MKAPEICLLLDSKKCRPSSAPISSEKIFKGTDYSSSQELQDEERLGVDSTRRVVHDVDIIDGPI